MFLGNAAYTNASGIVVFSTPEVNWDSTYSLLASKSGYDSTSAPVEIKNSEGFRYWYLLILVVIIMVVGIIAFFDIDATAKEIAVLMSLYTHQDLSAYIACCYYLNAEFFGELFCDFPRFCFYHAHTEMRENCKTWIIC